MSVCLSASLCVYVCVYLCVSGLQQQSVSSMQNQSLSEWIQMKVIPVYTVTSITYCKSLPGLSASRCRLQLFIVAINSLVLLKIVISNKNVN